MPRDRYALILATHDDVHAIAVSCEIEKQGGVTPIIIDAAEFPQQWALSLVRGAQRDSWQLHIDGITIDERQVTAVWHRRVKAHEVPDESQALNEFCYGESRSLFESWTYALGNRLINSRAAQTAANHKGYQLRCARSVGLKIPNTLMTNDAGSARRFLSSSTACVYKSFTPTQSPYMVTTRKYSDDMQEALEHLRFAPVIFQELVEKTVEVRVTMIDDQVFPIQIQPRISSARVDWRLDKTAEMKPHKLPPEETAKLHALMQLMGLRYGAIDLALGEDGQYVFFEVNPAGQFLFAEIFGDAEISTAFAEALCKRVETHSDRVVRQVSDSST